MTDTFEPELVADTGETPSADTLAGLLAGLTDWYDLLGRELAHIQAECLKLQASMQQAVSEKEELAWRLDEVACELAETQAALGDEREKREKAEARSGALEVMIENAMADLDPGRVATLEDSTPVAVDSRENPAQTKREKTARKLGQRRPAQSRALEAHPHADTEATRESATTSIALEPDETVALDALAAERGYPDRAALILALVRRELLMLESGSAIPTAYTSVARVTSCRPEVGNGSTGTGRIGTR